MYSFFESFFTDVAAKLKLLGREEGKANLVFVDSPEEADALLSALSHRITYPVLLVEYPDIESKEHNSGYTQYLSSGFAVLAPQDRILSGHDNARKVIYEHCKPAADAIISLMRMLDDAGTLDETGAKQVTLAEGFPGNWVGPLHNDLWGWRYEFTWKGPGGLCHHSNHWLMDPEPEPDPLPLDE